MRMRVAWGILDDADRQRVVTYWRQHGLTKADLASFPSAFCSALEEEGSAASIHLQSRFPSDLFTLLTLPLTLAELHLVIRKGEGEFGSFADLREMVEGGLLFPLRLPGEYTFAVVPQEVVTFFRRQRPLPPVVGGQGEGAGKQEAHSPRVLRHLLRFLARLLQEEELRLTRKGYFPKRLADRFCAGLELNLVGWVAPVVDPEKSPPALAVAYDFWRHLGVLYEDGTDQVAVRPVPLAQVLGWGLGPMAGLIILRHLMALQVPARYWGIPSLAGAATDRQWREWDWQAWLPWALKEPPEFFRTMERERVLPVLIWLELVEVREEPGRLLWRLTEAGCLLLGGEEQREVRTARVHPNFEVLLPPLASSHLLFVSELLGEVRQDEAVAVYEIGEKPVESLLRRGMTEAELLGMVRSTYGEPPEAVAVSLRRWARRHRRVRLLTGTFLHAPDAESAAAIRSLGLAVEEPAEGMFWVDPTDLTVLKNRLKRHHVAVPSRAELLADPSAGVPLAGLGSVLTGDAPPPVLLSQQILQTWRVENWRDIIDRTLLTGEVLPVYSVFGGSMRIVPVSLQTRRDGNAFLQYYRLQEGQIRDGMQTVPLAYLSRPGE